MYSRYFRATAILCLAILALDSIVSQLPHSHSHDSAPGAHANCRHDHSGCHHSRASTHSHACSHHVCQHSAPASSQPASDQSPVEQDAPCDHCTLCRHQSQAALTCTVVAPPIFHATCEPLPDQQVAQLAPATPHVYQGRGPPSWL